MLNNTDINTNNSNTDTLLIDTLGHKTSTRNIRINYDGMRLYVSKPMSYSNTKLSNSIAIFNLLAIESCGNCSSCRNTCYAMKAQIQYKNTYTKRALNQYLAGNQLDTLKHMLLTQIVNERPEFVRIHEAGDFLSQAYINMWSELIQFFPDVKFYAYTKVLDLYDFSYILSLKNFNLVNSVMPDGSINFGTRKFIFSQAKKYKGKVCPYGLKKDSKGNNLPVHCGTDCKACMNYSNIFFLIH